MHLALVSPNLPHPSSKGGPLTCWGIAKAMVEAGHRVTVLSLVNSRDPFNTPERRAQLMQLGTDLLTVERTDADKPGRKTMRRKLGELLRTDLSVLFPVVGLASRMKLALEHLAPDAILAYHWETLAALHGLNVAPRMALVGDPWHLPNLRRWQQSMPRPTLNYFRWTLRTLRELRYYPKFMVKLLNNCESSGCFQAQSAAWLREKGAPHCMYFRSPIADLCGARWQELRKVAPRGNKPKILLGPSNLQATSTSAGIRLFAREILPRLERELGPESFEVHVVGEGEPPPGLAKMLPRPSVKLRGRIEPPDPEFLSADIQLVPTPIVLGVRIRIIVGFSYGCCVVAHANDAVNLPEIVHEENALLASDGRGLAAAIVRAMRHPELRMRLAIGARQTYERCFTPEVAGAPIVAELERLVANRRH